MTSGVSSSSAILHILATVGPTPQMLTLLLYNHYDEPIVFNALHIPELLELTIHSSTPFCTTCIGPPLLPQCSCLQRLHMIQDFMFGRALANHVSTLSPHLTHLRLSRISPNTIWSADGILQDFEQMLFASSILSTAGLPPTLKRVLIQTANRMSSDTMKAHLRDRAMRDAQRRIVLLKTVKVQGAMELEARMDVLFYMGIWAVWEERVNGAESVVWDMEPSAILASYGYSAERDNYVSEDLNGTGCVNNNGPCELGSTQ